MVRSWRTSDGLPQDTVLAIAQTADRYLWTGTKGGLSRFDGVRFQNYGLRDGLKSLHVKTLAGDGQGGLWIGTAGGLGHWRDGVIRTWTTEDGLAHNNVFSLATDGLARVWLGTSRGLQHLGPDGLKRVGEAEGLTGLIVTLAASARGELWISQEPGGLFRLQQGRVERVELPPPCQSRTPASLLVDTHGDLWAGMGNGIVLRLHEGRWMKYDKTHGVPDSYIFCLAQGADGDIWAGSHEEGLYLFRDGRFRKVPRLDDSIRSVAMSRDGVVWVGTQAGGLNRLMPPRVEAFAVGNASSRGEVHGLAEDPAGHFWATTWGGSLHHGPLDALAPFTGVPALNSSPFLLAALRMTNGDLYVAGPGLVARRLAGAHSFEVTTLPGGGLTSLCEDADGSLLIGTLDGDLKRLVKGGFQRVPNGGFASPITAVLRGRRPGIWVATAGGLFHWDAGRVQRWTVAQGLPSDQLRALHQDSEGTLWIGTRGGGLAWLKEGRVQWVDSRQGLANDVVSPILEDDHGNLWLGSIHGISRVSKRDLFDVAAGRQAVVHPLTLDESDGMPSPECTSGYSPVGLRGRSGKLLFSTTRNIVAVDPNQFPTAAPPPPEVRIASVVADDKVIRPEAVKVTFAPGLREMSIEYTAFDFAKPEKIRFRHWLEGAQEDWTDVGRQRVAHFSLLPPGHYTFKVTAANEDGRWNETGASLAFIVQPYFWQTAWFRLVLAFFLMASGAGIVWSVATVRIHWAQQRESLARAEAEAQQRRNEVAHLTRVRALGDLAAALAHELSQPLTAILSNAQAAQRFLAQDQSDPAEIREILEDIVADDQRAGEVIGRLRALIRKGEHQLQMLSVNELIHEVLKLVQNDLAERSVAVVTELSNALPPIHGDRVQLQQVLINLLLNARDAMAETPAGSRQVTVRSNRTETGAIQVSVFDTGSGIPRGSEETIFEAYHTTKSQGLGLGLSLSRSIIAAHGGSLWAENRTEGGAVFFITLPELHDAM